MEREPDSVIERVIRKVSAQKKTDPLELPPLYGTIDPETLSPFTRAMDSSKLHFQYAGCHVLVHSDGAVRVSDEPLLDSAEGVNVIND